jgi:hypothetical protein
MAQQDLGADGVDDLVDDGRSLDGFDGIDWEGGGIGHVAEWLNQ